MADFSFEVKEKLGVLSRTNDGDFSSEVNVVSFGGKAAKVDIRKWDYRGDEPKMLKGIALSDEEAKKLLTILQKRYGGEDGSEHETA